jgi:hypothetical protein
MPMFWVSGAYADQLALVVDVGLEVFEVGGTRALLDAVALGLVQLHAQLRHDEVQQAVDQLRVK